MLFYSLLIFSILKCTTSFQTASFKYGTSLYFRAGQQNVISTLTGVNETHSYTLTFSSSMSAIPNVAYGIAKYQGIDQLLSENFQIFRTGLTPSSLSVSVQIIGPNNLYLLRVAYLAVEPSFPYHFNLFDNVPVNYSDGNLTDTTSQFSPTQTVYTNVINYTQQCAGRNFSRFNSSSLNNYKIALFMTSLAVSTTNKDMGTRNYQVETRMTSTILSQQTYQLSVALKVKVIVSQIHFSQIFYDDSAISNSNKYSVVFESWTVNSVGGYKEISADFKNNFIMGISDFTTPRGLCGFDYMWDWQQPNATSHGVYIYPSIMRNGTCSFNVTISSVFYIKKVQCPAPYYYFNTTTQLCQDQCGLYTYGSSQLVIQLVYSCKPCNWACSKCTSSNKCTECNNDDLRIYNGSCYCPYGYLDTYIVTKCESCFDPNCLICQKNLNYNPTPLPTDNATVGMKNLCVQCATGYNLNATSKLCYVLQCGLYTYKATQLVPYPVYSCKACEWGCSKCTSSNNCTQCNSIDMRIYNGSCYCPYGYLDTFIVTKCESCFDPNCLICQKNLNYNPTPLPTDNATVGMKNLCVQCATGYNLNATSKLCYILQCGLYTYKASQLIPYPVYSCKACEWGCSKCTSSNKCTQCNNADMRIYNGSCYCPYGYLDTFIVTLCESCLDPNCLICQMNLNYNPSPLPTDGITVGMQNLCVLCANGYDLNATTKSCYIKKDCVPTNNQLLNYDTNICEPCPLVGCLQCRQTLKLKYNNTIMDIMLVGTKKRKLSANSPYGIVSCAVCNQSGQYFMNLTTRQCQLCNISQCIKCSSLYACGSCNAVDGYFLNNRTKQCEKCMLEGCSYCLNLTACRVCDSLRGYFVDDLLKVCRYCGVGCSACSVYNSSGNSSGACASCAVGLSLVNNVCSCQKGHYLTILANQSSTSCQLCDSKCKNCINSSTFCTACYFEQYRLLQSTHLSQPLDNSCLCNQTNYRQSPNSTICQKINPILCDMGYYLSQTTQQCLQICGDGVRIEVECDDGNLIQTDGCSRECKIEKDFLCDAQIYELTTCWYVGNVTVLKYNVTKDPYDNVFQLEMKLQPSLQMYHQIDWQSGLYFQSLTTIDILNSSLHSKDILSIRARYYQNIKSYNISLQFNPVLNKSIALSSRHPRELKQTQSPPQILKQTIRILQHTTTIPSSQLKFSFIGTILDFTHTTNNLQIAHYPTETYATVKSFSNVFSIIMTIYIGVVFAALFLFKRIVPVLIVLVAVQLCFISLISIQNVQPQTFSVINNFDEVFGINALDVGVMCEEAGKQMTGFANLGFESCFVKNLNLMFLLQMGAIVCIVVGSLIQLRWDIGTKITAQSKRVLSNLVFFNLSNSLISVGYMNWSQLNPSQITLASIQSALTVINIIMIVNYKKVYMVEVEIEDFQVAEEEQKFLQQKSSSVQVKWLDAQKGKNVQDDWREKVARIVERYKDKESRQVQASNKQTVYFLLFITAVGCACPLSYMLFPSSSLVSNLITVGLIVVLIVMQITIKPFKHHNQPKESFSYLSTNYYIVYALMLTFLSTNLVFTLMDGSFTEGQIEKKLKFASVISYAQIVVFLVMLSYVVVAWSYAIYLSYFEEDVWSNYNSDKARRENNETAQGNSSTLKDNNKPLRRRRNRSPLKNTRQSPSKITRKSSLKDSQNNTNSITQNKDISQQSLKYYRDMHNQREELKRNDLYSRKKTSDASKYIETIIFETESDRVDNDQF